MNRLAVLLLIVCLAGVLVGGCGRPATAAPPDPSPTPAAGTPQPAGCKCNNQNHSIIATLTAGSQHP
jgi:hypothetical protein